MLRRIALTAGIFFVASILAALAGSTRPQEPLRLAVRVVRRPAGKPPADLRVIAARLEMWQELPESTGRHCSC